jgi:prolipoprotein diacylglyceryl transferase
VTVAALDILAEFPSPTQGVWQLGPIPIRAYALCILAGIVAACVITDLRMRRRGAPPLLVVDIAVWAVPFGIVGARIYHVITTPEPYFGANGHLVDILKIWNGGLGIWGAVAGGAVGALIACRRRGIPLSFFADTLAVGLPVAQAIGRWGNWFNNELHGGHTDLPWGLKVYDYDLSAGRAVLDDAGNPVVKEGGPFHPTFLYESIWNVGVALLVWAIDRKFKLGRGRAFMLYVMGYTVGRFWIEAMRTDPAHEIAGMRVNNWVSILVFLGALIYFLRVKGPQEHLRYDESGQVTVVTAEGEPIPYHQPKAAKTEATAEPDPDPDSRPDSDTEPESGSSDDEPAEQNR